MLLPFLCTLSVTFVASNPNGIVPKFNGKIIGGTETDIESHPYQVSIGYFGFHICGGAIITTEHVVTAAHCTYGKSYVRFTIRAGSSLLKNNLNIPIAISEITNHPNYSDITLDNDISIIKLTVKLNFNSRINSIPIQREFEPSAGSSAVISGWGRESEDGKTSFRLKKVTIKIIDRETCRNIYVDTEVTNNMICAGELEGNKDACQGDSGGPLVVDGKLCGLISWGKGCGRPNLPGVYTNIASVSRFIIDTAKI